jgi:hypothetical protein
MTLPGPPMRPRGGWDSASIFSPWITCGRGRVSRWSGATLTPRSSPSRALSVSEHGRAVFEFLALLDRAAIWAARGHVRDALAAIEAARLVLAGPGPVLLARADELEALVHLSLGDLHSAAQLASGLPTARRGLLLAKIALASGDHHAAQKELQAAPLAVLTPRRALVRQILLAAAAIDRGDSAAPAIVAGVLGVARRDGFLNTVVTTAPQLTSYLIEHTTQVRPPERIQEPGAERAIRVLVHDGARGVLASRLAQVPSFPVARLVQPVRGVQLPQRGGEMVVIVVCLAGGARVQRQGPDDIQQHGRQGHALRAGRLAEVTAGPGGSGVAGHSHRRQLAPAKAHAAGQGHLGRRPPGEGDVLVPAAGGVPGDERAGQDHGPGRAGQDRGAGLCWLSRGAGETRQWSNPPVAGDRRQRAALHYAVPRDDGHAPLPVPVHRMTALGPHMGEAD